MAIHAVVARLRVWRVILPAVLLAVCLLAAGSTSGASVNSVGTTPRGWVAYSAYRLQIAVPESWTVRYFQNCPGRGPGTLLIGTPLVYAYCAELPADADVVTMMSEKSETQPTGPHHVSHLAINGLRITRMSDQGRTLWDIPSRNVVVSTMGPAGETVARTLAPATFSARAAPGLLVGQEELAALETVNVTGPVSLVRLHAHGPALPELQAIDGQFSAQLPPGQYQLLGRAGNVSCPAKVVSIVAGEITRVTLTCQGD